MDPRSPSKPNRFKVSRNRILGGIAGVFARATLSASSSVLFGPDTARELAGDVVPFVVWFNFLAGFAYLAAAVGLWRGHLWGHRLAIVIALATAVAGLVFAVVALSEAPVEPRTGMALIFRCAVWAALAALSHPRRRA